jgi:hypothetical protein
MRKSVRVMLLLGCLALGMLIGLVGDSHRRVESSRGRMAKGIESLRSASVDQEQAEVTADSEQDALRQKLLGVWEDEYQGKRTMTLLADGTGTMCVELSGMQAALFASMLRFDMVWELEGRLLRKRTVGGEPAIKVNLILKMKGNTATDAIRDVTDSRLLLLDENGETEHEWRRVQKNSDETK